MYLTAQTSTRWLYVSLSADGWKFYRQDKIDKLENGNPATWIKLLDATGFYRTMYYEWDCKGKRYRLLQSHFFSPDAQLVSNKQPVDTSWAFLPPDSVAGILLSITCNPPVERRTVEIIVNRANSAKSIRTRKHRIEKQRKKGRDFRSPPARTVGNWFNVVDEETQDDYWIHRSVFEFIEQKLE